MISKAPKTTSTSLPLTAVNSDEILANIFHDTIPSEPEGADSRRRLEGRLEAARLRREMLEFDFE